MQCVLHEAALLGGSSSTKLVRVGDIVRRPAVPWSASVDALWQHVHGRGVRDATRVGYDEAGQQVLTFAQGFIDPDPSKILDLAYAAHGFVPIFADAHSATMWRPATPSLGGLPKGCVAFGDCARAVTGTIKTWAAQVI